MVNIDISTFKIFYSSVPALEPRLMAFVKPLQYSLCYTKTLHLQGVKTQLASRVVSNKFGESITGYYSVPQKLLSSASTHVYDMSVSSRRFPLPFESAYIFFKHEKTLFVVGKIV